MCNQVAPSTGDAQGTVQAGSRAETDGTGTRTWEIIYFKLCESQIIERAIDTAALMLRSNRPRGYHLEMICADLLAGPNLDGRDPETLLFAMTRFFKSLPGEQRQAFLGGLSAKTL